MADEQTNFSDRPAAERYYTEHVRISPDEGGDNQLLRADITEKLHRGEAEKHDSNPELRKRRVGVGYLRGLAPGGRTALYETIITPRRPG